MGNEDSLKEVAPAVGAKVAILIVEDEIILAMDMQLAIEDMGYKVAGIAFSGYDAILKADEVRPALVLVDIKLQGPMDGIEAARRIIHDRRVPIVFVTGNTDESTKQRALAIGPAAYLQKPVDDVRLRGVIEKALSLSPN
jgi:CheY-like chemotaxis protein